MLDADDPPEDPPAELDADDAEVEAGAEALLDELEEPPPQPATASASTTRAAPSKWRGCFLSFVFIVKKTLQTAHSSRRSR